MALITNYEIPNTGMTVHNAYHMVNHVDLIKRVDPIPYAGGFGEDPLQGETGYFALIYMSIYASKTAREQNNKPIAYLSQAMPEKPFSLAFVVDPSDQRTILTQAYEYLKSLSYYEAATED